MPTELYPYQKEGVRLIEKHDGRVLLADEQGLGKTIQVLRWIKSHPEIRPIVIVCPASVKYVWEDQAKEHCGLRVTVCSGQKPPRSFKLHERDIFIVNYDILFAWAVPLRKLHPKLVVFDEVHKLKSRSAHRTRAARMLCAPVRKVSLEDLSLVGQMQRTLHEDDNVAFDDGDDKIEGYISSIQESTATIKTQIPHLMGLSGTPLTNRPEELWSTLNLIWPQVFPAFTPFAWEFCDPEMTPYGWKYGGASNLVKLHRMLTRLGMIRRRKKDVLKDLPSKQRFVVPLEIDNRKEYDEALSDFINWLSRKDAAKAEKASKAEKMTQMAYLKRLAAKGKLKVVRDWIDSFLEESEDKLVVGCWHHDMIDALHGAYPKSSVTFTGKTPANMRRQAIRQFRDNNKLRIIFGNIQAIGTGVDGLQSVSHTSAVVELPWDPGTLSQFDDRIHRIGQLKGVSIYYLVARDTIEERLCRIIQEKQDVLTRTLDGEEHVEQRKIDIFDQLEKELLKGERQ